MNNKTKAFLIIAAAAVIVAGLFVVPQWLRLYGNTEDWLVHVEGATLVRYSEHIVIARYLDEAIHDVPNTPTAHAESPTSFVDVYRRFAVLETLKGEFTPSDTAYVAWNAGYFQRKEDKEPGLIPLEVNPLSPGATYVLFLDRRHWRRPASMDLKIGVWTTVEGLDVARVDSDGLLSFQTTKYNQTALGSMGLQPVPGSGAPFEFTAAEVRALAALPESTAR